MLRFTCEEGGRTAAVFLLVMTRLPVGCDRDWVGGGADRLCRAWTGAECRVCSGPALLST